jgi:predicted ATPase
MLTRLEVDGFKNLIRFAVDFGPFNCIAGPNGVGKSNIFDAIRFLSLLADNTLTDAARRVRGELEGADVRDLFWRDGEEMADEFRIAAEMIVERSVFDDIGREVEATSTYLRYEVKIGYEEADFDSGHMGGIFLLSEGLDAYRKEEAKERLRFPYTQEFFDAVIHHQGGRAITFITTRETETNEHEIIVHPNGTGSVLPQIVPATKMPRTIISASGTWTSPIILAARRQMESWRLLAMEPTAMRRANTLQADPYLTAQGGNVHATLYRMAKRATKYDSYPEQMYSRVRTHVGRLLPVRRLSVNVDPIRQLLMTELEQRFSGGKVPARSLSDGTLRFLTLGVLNEDPEFHGLVCIEEPENGIHPSKMEELVDLLKDMTVDTTFEPSWEDANLMRQVIIATHSPNLVQLLSQEDILFTLKPMRRGPKGKSANTIECWPLKGTWRDGKDGNAISLGSLLVYLKHPVNAQLRWAGISN